MLFSVASDIIHMALYFTALVIPRIIRALHSECLSNSLQLTSVGSQRACQPCLLHCSTSSCYLVCLCSLALSMQSSQDTISSHMIICLAVSEKLTRTRWSVVDFNFIQEIQLFCQIHSQLLVWSCAEEACSCPWLWTGILSSLHKRDGLRKCLRVPLPEERGQESILLLPWMWELAWLSMVL